MSAVAEVEGKAVAAKDEAQSYWQRQRTSRPWLDHAVRAYQQQNNTNGSLLASALTFTSFLALIPLLLLALSVGAFVLRSHPDTLQKLLDKIQAQAPGALGTTLKQAVNTATDRAGGLGIGGTAGVALTGVGWVSNLRTATEQVWEHPPLQRPFVKAKIADLLLLALLGVGVLGSVALSAAGSVLTGEVTKVVSFGGPTATTIVTHVLGIAVSVLAYMIVCGVLLVRLPRATVPRGTAVRAAVLAAVGLEILTLVATRYLASLGTNPVVLAFGPIIGVLIFLNLVFRFLLYCTAWTATGTPDDPLAARNGVITTASGAGRTAAFEASHSGGSAQAGAAGTGRAGAPAHSRGVALALTIGALARRRQR